MDEEFRYRIIRATAPTNEGGQVPCTNYYLNKKDYHFCWWRKLGFLIEYEFTNLENLRLPEVSTNS